MSAEKELVLELADEWPWGPVHPTTTRTQLSERCKLLDDYIWRAKQLCKESPDNAPCSPFGVGASG